MVRFISLAWVATFASSIFASPLSGESILNSSALAFPHQTGLVARRICINCRDACDQTAENFSAEVCSKICRDNEKDKHECLNSEQRKDYALAMFPNAADYINGLDKHEIKDFLRDHDIHKRLTKRFHINCQDKCQRRTYRDKLICYWCCRGSEDDDSENLNAGQKDKYREIMDRMDLDLDVVDEPMTVRRDLAPSKENDESSSDSDDESVASTTGLDHRSTTRLEKRFKHFAINCEYVCDKNSSAYNKKVCGQVCSKTKHDKKDCKEHLNKHQTAMVFDEYYYGVKQAIWDDCMSKHHRGHCLRDHLYTDYPDLKPHKHSGKCHHH